MKNPAKLLAAVALGFVGATLSLHPAHAASLALDQNFRTPLFAEPRPAEHTLLLPDGKFLLFYATETLTDQRTGAITRYLPNGALDPSFNFSRDYKFVSTAAVLPNGQLIIAATQFFYGDFKAPQILRVNPDGSVDPSFNPAHIGPDLSATVRAIVIQPDGKILIAGSFNAFAGLVLKKIVRLLPDGTLDSTFTPPQLTGGDGIHAKPVVLASGKILIAGDFANVDGAANPGVAQLNADGSVDSSFHAAGFNRGSGNGTPIRGMVVQSDGKILLGGKFQIGSGSQSRGPLLRLNADGSVDTSYTAANNYDPARDLVLQPDGKAVVAVAATVLRFNPNGSVDTSFQQTYLINRSFGFEGITRDLGLQPNGQILVAGAFTDIAMVEEPEDSHYGIARLNSDGTHDSSFVTSHRTGSEDFPSSFIRLPDGSTLVAFDTLSYKHDPVMANNLGRLLPNGSIDRGFRLYSSDPKGVLAGGLYVTDFTQLADGGLFVFGKTAGGGFVSGKFSSTGTEDRSFHADLPLWFGQYDASPDGKLVHSAGSDAQASVLNNLLRFQRDGSLDNAFQPPASLTSEQVIRDPNNGTLFRMYVGTHVLAIQPDGKILFVYLSSDELFHFLRLNADGSPDASFTATTLAPFDLIQGFPYIFDPTTADSYPPPGGVWSATSPLADGQLLSDGRILLCGPFTSFHGVAARGLVRLQPNGTIDNTFAIGGGAQWIQTTETSSFFPAVESVKEQVDGKLLIAGTFEAFNGTTLPGIASLNPNGSVDTSFTPVAKRQKFSRGSTRLTRQADGSFLLSGAFSFPNETEPTFIHINSIGGIPVIGSPPLATAAAGRAFSYQIVASGQPTSYSASGLPPGFTIDPATGLITGTPTSANIGTYTIIVTATNGEGTSAAFQVTLTIAPAPPAQARLQNISTRLRVLTGDNSLIGGFIIAGPTPKRIIIRAIGPSLTNLGIPGALTDPVLELHGPGPFATITNDNWRDAQQAEIEATGLAPGNNLESAIIATLPPGAYTAIVRGTGGGTGVGMVEAYDLDSTADSQLANISTRGFVDIDDNVLIGGIIAGPTGTADGYVLVRAIGPSLTSLGVPNALQYPDLYIYDGNGYFVAFNAGWKFTQQAAIEATGLAPTNDDESAILLTLPPGSYTAIVQGAGGSTGVGLVEVYHLQ